MTFLKKICLLTMPICFSTANCQAATPLMVSGHAGVVGQATYDTPPLDSFYSALRVPIGLVLQASPTDHLSLYLGFEYAYNNYPGPSVLLGQTTATSQGAVASSSTGTATPLPFANSVNSTAPYSQKTDAPVLTQAYFAYQTEIGVLRAGRMPRHWGLGVWRNTEWTPYVVLPSTSDAVSFYSDFNAFDVSLYYEKYGDGAGGTSRDAAAIGYTLEARLKGDPADAASSGVSKEIGISFTKFNHSQSATTLNILDFYERIYLSQFSIGSEILYSSGSTQSPNYQSLGGAPACTSAQNGSVLGSQTCTNQNISALAGILKLKLQLNGSGYSSLAATEKAQKNLGTVDREVSHTIGFWLGYASGGSNQFNEQSKIGGSNSITAIALNSSVQPSFLMFNNTMPSVNGMPGGTLTNTTFVRLNYVFENPRFGAVEPVFVWGWLNHMNNNFNAQNNLCKSSPVVDPNNSVNYLCVGGNKNLGAELDVSYHYTTLDRVTLGLDVGYWLVGNAWQVYGQGTPSGSLGTRASISTQF